MKVWILSLLSMMMLTVMSAGAQQVEPEWAAGLCGESLKEAVKAHCSPDSTLADAALWKALLKIDGTGDGGLLNRFGKEGFKADQSGLTMIPVFAVEWWMPDYALRTTLAADLHVHYLCDAATLDARKDYMPGVPSGKVFYDNGLWQTGEDELGQGVWSLPDGCRGELARAMLYAACVYPADLWVGNGAVFMQPGNYPSLSEKSIFYLLESHEAEPPCARELLRNEAIASLQGNDNPFVRWPEMAAHIWGDSKEMPYGGEAEGDDERDETEMTPLRGIYNRKDLSVDLVSPFVPDDASWTLDGNMVEGRRIMISDLTSGKHELRFDANGVRGKIVILVVD